MAFSDDWMRAPDTAGYIDTLRADLSRRKSVVLALPSNVEENEAWLALYTRLGNDFDVGVIELTEITPAEAAVGLCKALVAQYNLAEIPYTLPSLGGMAGLPEVLFLRGLGLLPSATQKMWLEVLVQWAAVAQQCRDRGQSPMTFCVMADASRLSCSLPETNVFLAVRWWWGVPSSTDIRGLCRLHSVNADAPLLAQWREHLLPALAGSDALLAAHLWDELLQPFETLLENLRVYAAQRQWSCARLQSWGTERFFAEGVSGCAFAQHPPEEWLQLWANGVLCYTPEYGCELHSAALAVLGRYAQISHRLWRGQAALLMPLIDAARLRVCEYLTEAYGCGWPLRKPPQEPYELQWLQEDPFSCQLGHLKNLLYDCFDASDKRRWQPLVYEANQVRRNIAHYRAVTFEDYKRLAEALQAA